MARATRPSGGSFSADIPAFYQASAPRPVVPLLMAQTEIVKAPNSIKLIGQQEINPTRTPSRNVRFAPYSRSTSAPVYPRSGSTSRRSPSPQSRRRQTTPQRHFSHNGPRKEQRSRQETPSDSSQPDEEEDDENQEDDEEEREEGVRNSGPATDSDDDDSEDGLIPKPEGEAGRPGRGGYNVEQAMGWSKKDYGKLMKFAKAAVGTHLDPARCYSAQSLSQLHVAVEKFPRLADFAKAWPVMDLVRHQLKYLAGRAKLDARISAASKSKSKPKSKK